MDDDSAHGDAGNSLGPFPAELEGVRGKLESDGAHWRAELPPMEQLEQRVLPLLNGPLPEIPSETASNTEQPPPPPREADA